ncbi:enoyl-CoA hydratase-related protein [Candidatus Odyssella acanthamoebae]|uniref:enoyl-CoA hydratase n=1 Tax=Candidatus Odyssella acanthamoebae TaxID=91604 RepID=A0A077AYY0_9PROT|nr:enoyl-CoA hydratase-related protein [Candidatus Paracaedibacter acanthamoebae]AIK97214.1 enoyl-CoA hydratase [Candidatus Paracaedibacter acanthamoebae]
MSTAEHHESNQAEEMIRVDFDDRVMIITLTRPNALNALCKKLIMQLNSALDQAENDTRIGVIVITGAGQAFAAGADISEMKNLTFAEVAEKDFIQPWERLSRCQKPVIAAINGYALGGGCEMAMMCDIIYASETAQFGQPEITIGTMPGAGGTQRLTALVGKSKAMELCLTGRKIPAQEAEAMGLVTRIFAGADLMKETMATAHKIAKFSAPVVRMIKEAVNNVAEVPLVAGIRSERRLFQSTFALEDRKEGMTAFLEKRPAAFKNR